MVTTQEIGQIETDSQLRSGGDVARALAMLAERVGGASAPSGEPLLEQARATIAILRELHADDSAQVAAALADAGDAIPRDEIERVFGAEIARLVDGLRQLLRLRTLQLRLSGKADAEQIETLRRMMLAMAVDIRVVLVRLATRVQVLRWHAANRRTPEDGLARQTLQVLAPLANRLGLWQLKWELEDLAFRFEEPHAYRELARALEEKRRERESFIAEQGERLRVLLAREGIRAEVSGRPKHIYSIWNKMRAKARPLDEIRDLRGLRVIVEDVDACYSALSLIHARWASVAEEFDDYISRPKPNGYQSLHTVVIAHDGKPLEVQVRTREMHRFAEYGVASHWRYKEASAAASGATKTDESLDARIVWLRQLLAWQREVGAGLGSGGSATSTESGHVFVLTPQARVIELPAGSTPVDFAYHVHTSLGHRCRGARVDGQLVPLNTALHTGQTVTIVSAKEAGGSDGPSRDWLNPQLGFVRSHRARAKVRQWFNALELERDRAEGRERVERVLQREGRTALSFDELARRIGSADVDAMFVAVAREEIGPRQLEDAARGQAQRAPDPDGDAAALAAIERAGHSRRAASDDGVLVVGVDLLMTQLAKCCRPVPPDAIAGFVTLGRGVSVHRADCATLARMAQRAPERVIDTGWGERRGGPDRARGYPVDVVVRAVDRPGLLRDVTELFARERMNVVAGSTVTRAQVARMQFTVEVADAAALAKTLLAIGEVKGVFEARRK
ncbi:MAG: RelA/SpoT family protein [Burkholderiaceae bacterium]|nr:RelA/SpoT family protein [Burkholderiaceae bacterium]